MTSKLIAALLLQSPLFRRLSTATADACPRCRSGPTMSGSGQFRKSALVTARSALPPGRDSCTAANCIFIRRPRRQWRAAVAASSPRLTDFPERHPRIAPIGGSDVVANRTLGGEGENSGTENNFLRFKVSLVGSCRNLCKRSNSSCQPAKAGAACWCPDHQAEGQGAKKRIIL